MKSFEELMATYKAEHKSKLNRLMHYIGIPAILFGVFILLNWVNLDFGTLWKISFAWILLILAAIYYFWLGQYKLAAVTTIVLVVLLVIASLVAGPYPTGFGTLLFVIFFFGGWAFLFFGHGMEKSKPAFTKSLWQLLIAPLFLVDELLSLVGLGSEFGLSKTPQDNPDDHHQPHKKDDHQDK